MKKMKDLHNITKYPRSMTKVGASILFIVLFMWSNASFATHIVGGDMTYKCLGNDRYEVTLMVYRDCFNGNPEADYDDPVSIAI